MGTELAKQRREQILAAASKCFLSKGFHATGMGDIAREFGMSAGHIYNYFPGKMAIIEQVLLRGTEQFYADTCQIQEIGADYDKLLAHLRNLIINKFLLGRARLSLELLLEGSRDPAMRKLLEELDVKARQHLLQLRFQNAQSPENLARIEISMATFEGLQLRMLRNPDLDLDAVCRVFADHICRVHNGEERRIFA